MTRIKIINNGIETEGRKDIPWIQKIKLIR